jgi:hypothetical protein
MKQRKRHKRKNEAIWTHDAETGISTLSYGGHKATINTSDFHLVEKYAWCISPNATYKYAHAYESTSKDDGKRKQRNVYLHRVIFGLAPGDGSVVDHINGDTLNNQRSNIRAVPRALNIHNSTKAQGKNTYRNVITRLNKDGSESYFGLFVHNGKQKLTPTRKDPKDAYEDVIQFKKQLGLLP